MVATNDDILAELQKHTAILKDLKKLSKGIYSDVNQANEELTKE